VGCILSPLRGWGILRLIDHCTVAADGCGPIHLGRRADEASNPTRTGRAGSAVPTSWWWDMGVLGCIALVRGRLWRFRLARRKVPRTCCGWCGYGGPSMVDPLCELANVTADRKSKAPPCLAKKTRDKDGAPGRHAPSIFGFHETSFSVSEASQDRNRSRFDSVGLWMSFAKRFSSSALRHCCCAFP
jgi:hypothetical protein